MAIILPVSLKDHEIIALAEEAREQTKASRVDIPKEKWDELPRIVAVTVGAQLIRQGLKELKKE